MRGAERVDHGRVELRSRAAAQFAYRRLRRARLCVRALGDHRVIRVADRDDPRSERDVGAAQAIGVAAAVPALVAGADELADRAQRRNPGEDALADDRVLAHDLPLALVEWPGLVQDG